MSTIKVLSALTLATLITPAFAQGMRQSAPATPGTITYFEGQAAINGKPVVRSSALPVLTASQMLATGTGHAELTLAPGASMQLGKDTVVKMIASGPQQAEVELDRGTAQVRVNDYFGAPANSKDLQIDTANGVQTVLLERGLYRFDAKAGQLMVLDGKAAVSQSDAAKKWIDVKGGHELALNGSASKPAEFDPASLGGGDFSGRPFGAYGYAAPGAYAGLDDGYAYYPAYYGYPYAYGFYPYGYGFYQGFYGGFGFGYGYGFGGYGRGFGGIRGRR